MKLLYVNADPGIPLHGPKGASVHVRETLRGFAPHVEDLTVLTARLGEPSRTGGSIPGRVLRIGPGNSGTDSRELDALAANDALEAELERAIAAGADAIYERYSLWSVGARAAARRHGLPWILEVNAPLVREASRHRSLRLRSVAASLENQLFRDASRILVVSRPLADYVVGRGADPRHVHVLPNGYDDTRFRAREKEPDGAPILAFAGSLKPWHGVDALAAAFPRVRESFPEARLRLIGKGPEEAALRQQLAASVPAGAYEFTGAVEHDRVPGLLAEATIAVAPYPALEDFYFSPLKIMEYAGLGLPIVASRIGQIEEILEHERSALLPPAGDVDALVSSLCRLLGDGALRRRIARGAREAVRERTWTRVTAEALEIVRGACGTPARCGVAS